MRRILCALLFVSTAEAAQIVVGVPPISTGRAASSMFVLLPEEIILRSTLRSEPAALAEKFETARKKARSDTERRSTLR